MRQDKDQQSEGRLLESAIRENAPLLIEKQLRSGQRLKDSDLFYAIHGQIEALRFLLDKGLNPNVADDSGNNLLFYITDIRVFELILSQIENINHQNLLGDTILHHLLRNLFEHKKSVPLIDLCLAKKPDLSIRNKKGQTVLLSMPLQDSTQAGTEDALAFMFSSAYFAIIDKLLAAGSSLAETDTEGNTLLHYVCKDMQVDRDLQATVEALVQRGAPINTKNSQGLNALAQLLTRMEVEHTQSLSSFAGDFGNSDDSEMESVLIQIADEEESHGAR